MNLGWLWYVESLTKNEGLIREWVINRTYLYNMDWCMSPVDYIIRDIIVETDTPLWLYKCPSIKIN